MGRSRVRRIPDFSLYGEGRRDLPRRYVHVETIEARSAPHHWKIGPHLHRLLHQMVLVLKGRGVAQAEAAVVPFRPPALTFAPAGAVHGFEFEPETEGFVISFAQELLEELTHRDIGVERLFREPWTLELPGGALNAPLVERARQLALEHAQTTVGRTLALEGWLALLLAQTLRLAQARVPVGALSPGRQLVERFRRLLEADLSFGRSIADHARALRVSEAQLRRACVECAGQPPLVLVHARVLQEAKRKLLYTSMPVREVGYGLGFEDPAYFTRFFTLRTGLSPRNYRLQGRRELTGAVV